MLAASPARQRFASRAGGGGVARRARVARPAALRHRVLRRGNALAAAARRARARARRVPHAPRIRDARAVGVPRGQPRGRDAGGLRRLAGARRAHAVSRGAVLLGRGAALPRPPSQRTTGAGRGRDGPGRGLRHGVDRPHLRPAGADRGGLAARPGHGRLAGAAAPVVLSAHDPPAHAVRGAGEARPALGASRGRAGGRSSSSRTASSRMRAGRRTRSPTSRAARSTSRGTTASTGTTRRTSASARRRTRSPPRTRRRRPAAGGTSEARRAGRDDSRRASVRSRRRSSWVRRTWRRRRCSSACAPRPGSTSTACRARYGVDLLAANDTPRRSPRGRGPHRRARRPGGRPVAGADAVRTGRGRRPGRGVRPVASELRHRRVPSAWTEIICCGSSPSASGSVPGTTLATAAFRERRSRPPDRRTDTSSSPPCPGHRDR